MFIRFVCGQTLSAHQTKQDKQNNVKTSDTHSGMFKKFKKCISLVCSLETTSDALIDSRIDKRVLVDSIGVRITFTFSEDDLIEFIFE